MKDAKTIQEQQTDNADALAKVQAEVATIATTKPADRSPAQNARLQDLELERQDLVKEAETIALQLKSTE